MCDLDGKFIGKNISCRFGEHTFESRNSLEKSVKVHLFQGMVHASGCRRFSLYIIPEKLHMRTFHGCEHVYQPGCLGESPALWPTFKNQSFQVENLPSVRKSVGKQWTYIL